MEVAPYSWFWIHHIRLWSWRRGNVVQVKNLAPYFFAEMFRCMKLSVILHIPFNVVLYLMGGIINLLLMVWTFCIGNTLLDISCLFFGVSLLALYITLWYGDHFSQGKCWLLGERIIKMSCLKSILECPLKHFLAWSDDPDGGFVKPLNIVPQRLWWSLSYIEQPSGGHIVMTDGGKLFTTGHSE